MEPHGTEINPESQMAQRDGKDKENYDEKIKKSNEIRIG